MAENKNTQSTQLQQLQEQVDTLTKENVELVESLRQAEANATIKESNIAPLKEANAALQAELKDKESNIATLKEANADLQAKLKDAEEFVHSLNEENNELRAQVKSVVEAKTEPAAPKKAEVVKDPFTYEGKKYQLLVARVVIPGVGARTASEIVYDDEDVDGVKKFLVSSESGLIREVL